jgi:hypothetical protein
VISVRVNELPAGTLEALRALPGVDSVSTASPAAAEGSEETQVAEGDETGPETGTTVEVLSRDAGVVIASVVTALTASGARVTSIDVREPNLESVFLHLTGKSLRD